MKRNILLATLVVVLNYSGYSQTTTSYGQNASTVGERNSFFGRTAGSGGNDNTGIGFQTLSYVVGTYNTAVGSKAMEWGGYGCTGIGYYALEWNGNVYPPSGEHAYYNTAVGFKSMSENAAGDYNTAVGAESLYSNHSNYNSAFGYHALRANSDGQYNTATGAWSLYSNVGGDLNTGNGYYSLYSNTSGYQNTGVGYRALYSNTTGYRNSAIGSYALHANINGNFNTATGYYAAYSNNIGTHNTANGFRALDSNTTGNYNTADGAFALEFMVGGSYNSAFGYNAGPTSDLLNNTTAIGYNAVPTASNQVRIGNTSVTSIGGYEGWTDLSDGRFKNDVKEDVSGLEFISQLRPVSYVIDKARLNEFLHVRDSSSQQTEAKSIPVRKTGFIAQEVEALVKKTGFVFSGVDAPDNENDPYGIRYAEFVAPLVKAVQELTGKLDEQQKQIEEQQKQIESLLGSKSSTGFYANTNAALLQNNPNPFDAETEINLTLPDNVGTASVIVYNLEGKQLKNIQITQRGDVRTKISANELAPGMYLYSLIVDGKVVDTKRMILTE